MTAPEWQRPKWSLELSTGERRDYERAPLLPIRIFQRIFYGWTWKRMRV